MKIVKWLAIGAGSLVVLVLVVLTGARVVSASKLASTFEVRPFAAPTLPTDEISLAEGKRLFSARGCADCHDVDGGGKTIIDDPAIGKISGTNITRGKGGLAPAYTDADFVRAVKHCVKPDGSAVVMMPCVETQLVPDRELVAIMAWVKQLPAVDRDLEPADLAPVGHVLRAFGIFPLVSAAQLDFDKVIPPAPEPGPTVAFGERLAQIQCVGCHGDGLSGGPMPGAPPSLPVPTNITADATTGIGKWSKQHFVQLMKTGKRPDGTEVDPFMPWRTYSNMNDTEMEAVWAYLRSRPVKPFGNR